MTKQIELAQLKALSPIDSLKKDNLHALVKKTKVRDAQPGEVLFREGDSEKRTVYVLNGTVELREGDATTAKIVGGADEARHPLSPKLPRRQTAIATSSVEYITIDSDLLDVMLTWDQTGSYEVAELRGETGSNDDWMTTLLQTKAFHKIPPANIQAIFMTPAIPLRVTAGVNSSAPRTANTLLLLPPTTRSVVSSKSPCSTSRPLSSMCASTCSSRHKCFKSASAGETPSRSAQTCTRIP